MVTSLERLTDVHSFSGIVRPWLLRDEIENNLLLSIVRGIATSEVVPDNPYFAVIRHGDEIVGCALRTPPHKLLLTGLPADAVSFLVHDVGTVYRTLPAVLGPEETARAFAVEWATLKGIGFRAGMSQRLYALKQVIHPNKLPPGRYRLANSDHLPVASEWLQAFVAEAGAFSIQPDTEARRLIEGKGLAFWEQSGPVSMAAVSGKTDNGVRIGWVYTPLAHRRKGYAAALVAQLSERELNSGARFCMLYTDLGNPSSNRIYQRLGYRPISDIRDYEFAEA